MRWMTEGKHCVVMIRNAVSRMTNFRLTRGSMAVLSQWWTILHPIPFVSSFALFLSANSNRARRPAKPPATASHIGSASAASSGTVAGRISGTL